MYENISVVFFSKKIWISCGLNSPNKSRSSVLTWKWYRIQTDTGRKSVCGKRAPAVIATISMQCNATFSQPWGKGLPTINSKRVIENAFMLVWCVLSVVRRAYIIHRDSKRERVKRPMGCHPNAFKDKIFFWTALFQCVIYWFILLVVNGHWLAVLHQKTVCVCLCVKKVTNCCWLLFTRPLTLGQVLFGHFFGSAVADHRSHNRSQQPKIPWFVGSCTQVTDKNTSSKL